MAMTSRLSSVADEVLAPLARSFPMSNDQAPAAIDLAAPESNHPEFVHAATTRLLARYGVLLARFAEA